LTQAPAQSTLRASKSLAAICKRCACIIDTAIDTAKPQNRPLADDIAALHALIAERDATIVKYIERTERQEEQIGQLLRQLETLQQQFLTLRRMHFGATSERLAGQAELFTGTVSVPVPAPPELETVSYKRAQSNGRPSLPKDLPRQRIDYDLSETEKAEFDTVAQIGEEVSETLEYTPPVLTVIEHARAKYRCEKDGESTIRTAAAEPSPLPKSNAGAGLLAHVLVSKYQDHLPLNRQERMFGRHNVPLSKTTLCDWTLGAADLLERLIAPLTAHVLAAAVVGADDTTLQLAQSGAGAGTGVRRGKTRTARLWAYQCGRFKSDPGGGFKPDPGGGWAAHAPAVMFDFTESREGLHPLRVLGGYAGYLQADAYAGFDALFRAGRIIEVACWAHARRKFFEVAKSQPTPGLAHEALRFIAALYAIESEIREQTPAERLRVRQLRSVPLLANFKVWLDAHGPKLLPKSLLGNAFAYALANWAALNRYTECGILEPDNNAVERAIRPIALGRNNWLFAGSVRGGRAAATILSLIETAKLNGIDPFAYLRDVLARINSHRVDRLAELLPFNWQPRAA
jgi:transposase